MATMTAGRWVLRRELADGIVVWAVPKGETAAKGQTVLGWVRELPDGTWQRYPPDGGAPALPDAESAVLDVIEYREHEQRCT